MRFIAQASCFLCFLTALHGVAGNGEVGGPSNACYNAIPSDLPITISYSRSANTTATTFTFLVNVRQPTVDAFGIRLSAELAAVPLRISSIPAGQIIPPEVGGPAWLWNITSMGARVFTFTVDTSGLVEANGAMSPRMSALRLSDICAQGIVVADDQGNPFWEQPTTTSTCVAWVKAGDDCTFQTVSDNSTAPSSPRLDLLSAPAAAPEASNYPLAAGHSSASNSPRTELPSAPASAPATSTIQTSSTNSTASDSPRPELPSAPAPAPLVSTPDTSPAFSNRTTPNSPGLNQPLALAPALSSYNPPAGLYSPSPLPSPYGYSSPSPSPSPYSPTPYSSRPTPYAYTAPPRPVASLTPAPLFGISSLPVPSPRPGGYSEAYLSPRASPYGYGATPYGHQPSPAAAASPYYGIPTPGSYSSSRALLEAPAGQPMFGRRLLQTPTNENL